MVEMPLFQMRFGCLFFAILVLMSALSSAEQPDGKNLLANPDFSTGLDGWTVSAPDGTFSIKEASGVSSLAFFRGSDEARANPYVAQGVDIERCYYRLSLRYRTDGQLAPTILFYLVGREGKAPGPIRIIRLPAATEWTDFSVEFLGGGTDLIADVEMRLYPGTVDPLRMNNVYEAGSFVPAGGHSGTAEFTDFHLEKLPKETESAARGPFKVQSEEFTVATVDGLPLKACVDMPVGDKREPRPVIVWIFGGGWVHGDVNSLKGWSGLFASRGFPGVRVQYRWLSQGGNVDTVQDDLRAAIAWVKEHAEQFGWDPDRMIFAGSSAGGHLAAFLGVQTPECIGIIGFPGMYDLVDKYDGNFGRSSKWLKGTSRENWESGSPAYHMREPSPNAFLLHGAMDPAIDVRQAVNFAEVVNAHGGHGEAVIFPEMAHGIALTPEIADKMEAFMLTCWQDKEPTDN